ncbi:hypothetical protein AB7Y49_16900 [Providencia vermicola]|uniref:Uncharacterized protein n=1 Tax=Providencia vermicola TaxID=333965 RepID=A0AAX3RYE7_9GAMM|nr:MULTISPECIES: hypothetical protein [Providencia]ELX8380802.1 hypothetical protein [Providencia stuartii]EMD5260340.1 hypothetical protein [Providencia stuartii]USB38669.1 hypothetical protein M5J11_09405 [Providencia vermicola]WFC07662.1 hypothetical protein PG365_04545 [Providencia vermicola]
MSVMSRIRFDEKIKLIRIKELVLFAFCLVVSIYWVSLWGSLNDFEQDKLKNSSTGTDFSVEFAEVQ